MRRNLWVAIVLADGMLKLEAQPSTQRLKASVQSKHSATRKEPTMATQKQRQAAKRNIRKAQRARRTNRNRTPR